jgi:hypothetical protein
MELSGVSRSQKRGKDSEYDDGKEPLLLEPIHENSFIAAIRAKKMQEVRIRPLLVIHSNLSADLMH